MKKKLFVYSLAVLSLFAMTGCSNSQAQALTTLENQTERVDNIIAQSEIDDISSVSPSSVYNTQGYSVINNHRVNSYNNMTREEILKEEVKNLNSSLKCCLKNNVKLSKSQANSIKTLSNNLSSNLSKFNETKNKVKNAVKNIKQNLKFERIDIPNAESDYITLNGNMNERYAYLCNIYDNLEQAYILICGNKEETTENDSNIENSYETNSQDEIKHSRFKKNIDSYAPTENTQTKQETETEENRKNIDSFPNMTPPGYNYNNPYHYGNPYGYGYGYNGYGYANGYRRFNPNRNTDSFYPYNRNIDTYRTFPTNYINTNANNDLLDEEQILKTEGNDSISKLPEVTKEIYNTIENDKEEIEKDIQENGVIKLEEKLEDFIAEVPKNVDDI